MYENKYAVSTTIRNNETKPVEVFTFKTAQGKELTVNGSLAHNVCSFLNFDYMDKGANLSKAYMFYKATKLDVDWKSQFNVKDAKAFYTNFLGIDKTTFEKYALASGRMLEEDEAGKITFKLPCLDGITIGKLVLLNQYFAEAGKSFNDENEIENYALSMIEKDFADGNINLFMTDKKFDENIKKSFKTVEIEAEIKDVTEDKKPEDKKPEDKKPEDKKPEGKKPEDKKSEDKKPEDKKPEDNTPSKADKEGPTLKSMYEKLRSAMDVVEDTTTDERAKYKALLEAVKYSLDMLS